MKKEMKKVHVFTSAAFNYIPKVRMLFQSLREYHPEFVLHLALADELHPEIDLSSEPFDEVMSVESLDIPDWKGWTFCHQIVELATAIKPFALLKLLNREDCSKVLYLDPDTVVFSRLDDILAALDESNFVLTPHQTSPETRIDAVMDNEISSLKHGIYNLGFIGVTSNAEGIRFAEWWANRLYHFCRADIKNGLFTDQRWIDLVPAFFEGVSIMRSGRHNVAPWNLSTRQFSGDSQSGFFVDSEPLGFYHFTGFDSGAHRIMAAKNAGGNASVLDLINWYDNATKVLVEDDLAKVPWAFGKFTNGTKIQGSQRIVYRERGDLQKMYPDPFDANGYFAWWNHQGRSEYPKLFDAKTEAAEISRLTSVLTSGFNGGASKQQQGWDATKNLISSSLKDAATAKSLARRGWQVLKREGVSGVLKRLNK